MKLLRPSEKIPEHVSETLNVMIELLRLKSDAALEPCRGKGLK